jgi:hypothetical protein
LGTVDVSISHPQILYSPPNTLNLEFHDSFNDRPTQMWLFHPQSRRRGVEGSRGRHLVDLAYPSSPSPTALNAPTKNRFNFPPPHPVKSHQTPHEPRGSATFTPNWNFVDL